MSTKALAKLPLRRPARRLHASTTQRDERKRTSPVEIGTVVTALKVTGQIASSVPFLPGITEATVTILERVDNVKRNRRECKELAELAQTITTALVTATSGIADEDMDDDMKLNLAEYEWRLQRVVDTMRELRSRSWVQRLLRKDEQEAALAEHRESLKNAWTIFQVRYMLRVLRSLASHPGTHIAHR
ncbi:hypothetical protein C8Q76DRAFT_617167 [Earliella scabrosa]|nr:hypothetical protein C8Q76DRAFT_617167 [Earliella scabrosa]